MKNVIGKGNPDQKKKIVSQEKQESQGRIGSLEQSVRMHNMHRRQGDDELQAGSILSGTASAPTTDGRPAVIVGPNRPTCEIDFAVTCRPITVCGRVSPAVASEKFLQINFKIFNRFF